MNACLKNSHSSQAPPQPQPTHTKGLGEKCNIGISEAEAALILLCLCRGPSILPRAGSQAELKPRPTNILEMLLRL